MSKKDFLQKLKDRLRILNQHEIEDIIEEYEGHINEKVASGKTEEEAIQDFGDFDELVKEILSAYKINEDYENKIKEKNVIQDFVESCVQFFKDLIKNISKRSKEDIIKFIENVVLDGNDYLAEGRHKFVQKYLGKVNGKMASENIYDEIVKYLEKGI